MVLDSFFTFSIWKNHLALPWLSLRGIFPLRPSSLKGNSGPLQVNQNGSQPEACLSRQVRPHKCLRPCSIYKYRQNLTWTVPCTGRGYIFFKKAKFQAQLIGSIQLTYNCIARDFPKGLTKPEKLELTHISFPQLSCSFSKGLLPPFLHWNSISGLKFSNSFMFVFKKFLLVQI